MKNKLTKPWLRFWIVCLAVALVMGLAAAVGLTVLSGFLTELEDKNTAMENARPEVARDEYMALLTPEAVAGKLDDLYETLDTRLQPKETAQAVVVEELAKGIGYQLQFSSADKQTYLLYSKQPIEGKYPQIGSFTIAPKGETVHGYTKWTVVEERFSLDYLKQESLSVTVPASATVWFAGQQLGSEFITQADVPYPSLASLPQELPLPKLQAYTTGAVLGDGALEARDPAGNALDTDDADYDRFLPACDEDRANKLEAFCKDFLKRYTRYTSTSYSMYTNLHSLQELLVSGSELDQQMEGATDGLVWIKSSPDTVKEITYNRFIPLENGKFICDVTYTVNLKGRVGSLTQTVSAQIVVADQGGLKAENLIFY